MARPIVTSRVGAAPARTLLPLLPEAGVPSARVRRRSSLPYWAIPFLTAVLVGVAGLFGAGSAWAMAVSASAAAVVTAEPETAPHPASTVPSSTYDTVAYAYDAPAQLSSLNAAAAGARGLSADPGVTSWQRSGSARGFGVAANTGSRPTTLFHYTDDVGMQGIVDSGKLNPSLRSVNPADARYGNGQYLSDIAPGTRTCAQLSRCFLGQPFQGQRFTNFVEVNVDGLEVLQGRPNVFVVPGEAPLDLSGRIVGFGAN